MKFIFAYYLILTSFSLYADDSIYIEIKTLDPMPGACAQVRIKSSSNNSSHFTVEFDQCGDA